MPDPIPDVILLPVDAILWQVDVLEQAHTSQWGDPQVFRFHGTRRACSARLIRSADVRGRRGGVGGFIGSVGRAEEVGHGVPAHHVSISDEQGPCGVSGHDLVSDRLGTLSSLHPDELR